MRHGRYMKRDVLNLARFISVSKTKPLSWRLAHPYLVADRFEVCALAVFLVCHVCDCIRGCVVHGRSAVLAQLGARLGSQAAEGMSTILVRVIDRGKAA